MTYTTLEEYFKNELNYDNTKDKEIDKLAKETLSDWDFFKYRGKKNLSKLILENLTYKMLIPSIDDEYADYTLSPIMAMIWYEWDSYMIGFKEAIKSLIMNLTEDEIIELKTYDRVGLELIDLMYFHIDELPAASTILEFTYGPSEYGSYEEAYSGDLKDPFYSFPELDIIFKLQKQFKVKTVAILKVFDEGLFEYTDHKYDEKHEDRIYFEIARDRIKGKNDNNDIEKLEKLEEYERELKDIQFEKEVLNSSKGELSYQAKQKLSRMFSNLTRRRERLPYKYRDLNSIEKEIKKVLS